MTTLRERADKLRDALYHRSSVDDELNTIERHLREACEEAVLLTAKALEGTAVTTETLLFGLQRLISEVDCRIQHGAESGGHLEYVHKELVRIYGAGWVMLDKKNKSRTP
jgi:hypothetical protein